MLVKLVPGVILLDHGVKVLVIEISGHIGLPVRHHNYLGHYFQRYFSLIKNVTSQWLTRMLWTRLQATTLHNDDFVIFSQTTWTQNVLGDAWGSLYGQYNTLHWVQSHCQCFCRIFYHSTKSKHVLGQINDFVRFVALIFCKVGMATRRWDNAVLTLTGHICKRSRLHCHWCKFLPTYSIVKYVGINRL